MALENVWQSNGQPISYNPLPNGWNNKIAHDAGKYIIRVKGRSAGGNGIQFSNSNNSMVQRFNFTPESTVIEFEYLNPIPQNLFLYNAQSKSDVIIESMELLRQPVAVKKVARKNLVNLDLNIWTIRPATTDLWLDGDGIYFKATQKYAGANYFLDSVAFAGKTATFSYGDIIAGTDVTIFYKDKTGQQFYVGVDSRKYNTITFPTGITELRYYVQNANEIIVGKTYGVSQLQVEFSSVKTPYEAYAEDNRVARDKANLWTKNPTEYSPMSTGWGAPPLMDLFVDKDTYRMTFKAKSAKGSVLRVCDTGSISVNEFRTLTPDFEEYVVEFTNKRATVGVLMFYDVGSGDIFLKDIKVVKVRNNKAVSANLFDYSSPNIVKDSFVRITNGEISSSTSGNISTDFIPVEANTKYTAYNSRNAQSAGTAFYDKNKVYISGTQSVSFTTPDKCAYLRTTVNNSDLFTAQVQKGDYVKYEAFKQLKPAKKVISKNMLPPFSQWSANSAITILGDYEWENNKPTLNYQSISYFSREFEKGQTYTLSVEDSTQYTKMWVHFVKGTTQVRQSAPALGDKVHTFTTPTDIDYDGIRVILDNADQRGRAWVKNPQLEKGSVRTPFEPYGLVNRNKRR